MEVGNRRLLRLSESMMLVARRWQGVIILRMELGVADGLEGVSEGPGMTHRPEHLDG